MRKKRKREIHVYQFSLGSVLSPHSLSLSALPPGSPFSAGFIHPIPFSTGVEHNLTQPFLTLSTVSFSLKRIPNMWWQEKEDSVRKLLIPNTQLEFGKCGLRRSVIEAYVPKYSVIRDTISIYIQFSVNYRIMTPQIQLNSMQPGRSEYCRVQLQYLHKARVTTIAFWRSTWMGWNGSRKMDTCRKRDHWI